MLGEDAVSSDLLGEEYGQHELRPLNGYSSSRP